MFGMGVMWRFTTRRLCFAGACKHFEPSYPAVWDNEREVGMSLGCSAGTCEELQRLGGVRAVARGGVPLFLRLPRPPYHRRDKLPARVARCGMRNRT